MQRKVKEKVLLERKAEEKLLLEIHKELSNKRLNLDKITQIEEYKRKIKVSLNSYAHNNNEPHEIKIEKGLINSFKFQPKSTLSGHRLVNIIVEALGVSFLHRTRSKIAVFQVLSIGFKV